MTDQCTHVAAEDDARGHYASDACRCMLNEGHVEAEHVCVFEHHQPWWTVPDGPQCGECGTAAGRHAVGRTWLCTPCLTDLRQVVIRLKSLANWACIPPCTQHGHPTHGSLDALARLLTEPRP